MYKIEQGSTQSLADTTAFIEMLNSLPDYSGGDEKIASLPRGFFDNERELTVTRAPGRLDLMGGIADYSGSLVLELPIADATHVALQLREEDTIRIISLPSNPNESLRVFEMSLKDFRGLSEPVDYATARARFFGRVEDNWAAYVAGAFLALMRERGSVFEEGAHILISSAVPEGKGVSSSASLEVAAMQAITAAYEIAISPRETAFLCQRVENFIAGAPCGVMDQMTVACGDAGRLLALLCQPGEIKGSVELPGDLAIWGIDSAIRHSVGGADYGTVRTAAFMGYRMIADMAGLACREADRPGHVLVDDPKWKGYLANLTPEEFERDFAKRLPNEMSGAEFLGVYRGITDPVTSVSPDRSYPVYEATRHPIYENHRVGMFADILKNRPGAEQANRLGQLMFESHASYSACGLGSPGTDEIVRLVREAGTDAGLFGAKITGGGSGGTVAALGLASAERAIEAVAREYAGRTGREPFIIAGSSPGAGAFGNLKLVRED